MIKEIAKETEGHHQQLFTSVTSVKVKRFFVMKGFTVCNVTPIKNSRSWFAILIKDKEFITAKAYANEQEIERFEARLL